MYNDEQLEMFKKDPSDAYKTYCKMIEGELNQRFQFIINGSKAQNDARDYSENEMKDLLKGSSRTTRTISCLLTSSLDVDGLHQAMAIWKHWPKRKSTAFTEQLGRITEKGFIDPDGTEVEVDVIICATGFDTSYKPRTPLVRQR